MKKTILIFCLTFGLLLVTPFLESTEATDNQLPSFFSWTNIDGIDYSTPVKNQAPAPTCESYALCAAVETKLQYNSCQLYNPDLSETHLYFYAGGSYDDGYVNIEDAADYLITHGVPDEGCYPDPHRPFDYPYTSVEGWENRTVKITEWGWVERNQTAIKEALIEYGPLPACFNLYKDFNHYSGGVYQHTFGPRRGGHVMTIFGYDDINQCWIIKNSGGPEWGENGYIRMHYDSTWFAEWYGQGTGVMYVDGVYGNINPDVPKVYIQYPQIFHSYILGYEFNQILRNIPRIQKAAPRIIGPIHLKASAENTEKIEIYVDDTYQVTDETPPYEYSMQISQGLHTIKVLAYDADGDISRDLLDIYMLF